ncbi:MAG TPA: (Fe-S)-binding protein [Thermodesulfobacteriota bacterium]|nr:(Fe-S)-binding protein [Thermodesulfobacteriota bacterium]
MSRIPYWNIDYGFLIDLLFVPALLVCGYGFYRQWKRLRLDGLKLKDVVQSVRSYFQGAHLSALVVKGVINSRLYRKILAGGAHAVVMWGMAILFLGSFLVFCNVIFGLPVFQGRFNAYFMAFGLDAAGSAATAGLLALGIRRLAAPGRLREGGARKGVTTVESVILVILVTGFMVEGLRIAVNGPEHGAFMGNLIGGWLQNLPGVKAYHEYLWWVHGILGVSIVAYIPYSFLQHIAVTPLNGSLRSGIMGLKLRLTDFAPDEEGDSEPVLGCSKVRDLPMDNRLDSVACTWCGRCHEVCPAVISQKALSPKAVVTTIAQYLEAEKYDDASLVDEVGAKAIYSCTTCGLCMEVCPAYVKQTESIIRLRQYLCMEKAEVPETMERTINSLEARYYPFFGTDFGEGDWRKDLEVPEFESGETEYLLWIGCFAKYDERVQSVARATVQVLNRAGVSFGILENGRCCGDPGRQIGNDFMYSELAQQNIDEFNEAGVTKILTICPHCFDSFKHYYAQLGGVYEVHHHAQFINNLIQGGKISCRKENITATYHDACYLARHNGIIDEPRQLLSSSVQRIVAMPRTGKESFCCGGGGGNYWGEEEGKKINALRAEEALGTGADVIATACPYCLLMLTDGVKEFTGEKRVFDIVELLNECQPHS